MAYIFAERWCAVLARLPAVVPAPVIGYGALHDAVWAKVSQDNAPSGDAHRGQQRRQFTVVSTIGRDHLLQELPLERDPAVAIALLRSLDVSRQGQASATTGVFLNKPSIRGPENEDAVVTIRIVADQVGNPGEDRVLVDAQHGVRF